MNLAKMQKYGVGIDFSALHNDIIMPMLAEQEELTNSIHSVIGYRNLNHADQIMRGLMLNGFAIDSLCSNSLKAKQKEHTVFSDLYRYKRNAAFLTQYDIHLKDMIDNEGRVHPTYIDGDSITGRLKSVNPSIMSFDARVMKYFIPAEGKSLLHLDYKAMEFRALAALSRDPILIRNLYSRDYDIHTENASLIFNKPPGEIDTAKRKTAKSLGFAILYGMSATTLSQKLSKSLGTEVTSKEAFGYIQKFYNTYPLVEYYQRKIKMGGPCTTLKGRLFSNELNLPQRLNYPIQGTAADAFNNIINIIEKKFPEYQICLPLHDALFIEVPQEDADRALKEIQAVMEESMTEYLNIPSYVDVEIIC